MKSFIRLFLFMFCFTIEVHVRAETESLLIEIPENCRTTKGTCALKAVGGTQNITISGIRIEMAKGASVIVSESQMSYLTGDVMLFAEKQIALKTKYAEVLIGPGQLLLTTHNQNEKLYPIQGDIQIKPLGQAQWTQGLLGAQYVISAVSEKGYAEMDFPESAPFAMVATKWSQISSLSKSEFLKNVKNYKQSVGKASAYIAHQFQLISERQIASHKEYLKRKAEEKKKQEAENKILRDMFREKNYM